MARTPTQRRSPSATRRAAPRRQSSAVAPPRYTEIQPCTLEAFARLIAEATTITAGLSQRKRHVLTGLCRLVNAQIFVWTQLKDFQPDVLPTFFAVLEGGWLDDNQRSAAIQAVYCEEHPDPIWRQIALNLGPHITVRRCDLISDRDWYGNPNVSLLLKAARIDDRMYSVRAIGDSRHGLYSSICMVGLWSGHRFTEADRALLHLAATSIDWLHDVEPAPPGALAGNGSAKAPIEQRAELAPILSHRQRQVLVHLLSGKSQKQIARAMNLSQHTIGDHIKELYKHFHVTSRSELQARYLLAESEGSGMRG